MGVAGVGVEGVGVRSWGVSGLVEAGLACRVQVTSVNLVQYDTKFVPSAVYKAQEHLS